LREAGRKPASYDEQLLRGDPRMRRRRQARMGIHRIASELMLDLGSSSKLNAEWGILTMLRDEGRKAAQAFLHVHCDDLGRVSSLNLHELLQGV
jgi:NTE family protein